MSWFQTDDKFPTNRKPRALAERAVDGNLDGLAALGLWDLAGADCQASGTDGVVRRTDAIRLVLNPEIVDYLAGLLVGVRLWHAPGHDCPRCPAVEPGTWLFHDWFDIGYDRAESKRLGERKKAELKNKGLINQVWARDCTDPGVTGVGKCRYCGVVLKRKDTRSAVRPFIDHVDPTKAEGVRNLVLACSGCNQKKGNRTPAEAGMKLLPQPRPTVATVSSVSPQRAAAGNVSPGNAAAGTFSPSPSVAGTDETVPAHPGTPATVSQPSATAGQSSTGSSPLTRSAGTTDRESDHSETTDRPRERPDENHGKNAVLARTTRTSARQVGSGWGKGLGRGVGEGSGVGSPADPHPREIPRKRRRRRGRGQSTPQSQPVMPPVSEITPDRDPNLDAGEAPEVFTPARFASPWNRWTGPPSTVDETTCRIHNIEDPCWKCDEEGPNR
ncbi:HNH endonuclease [Rhodococcus sp. IEGM 1318]|uniref:HNH endonuclease n=1 Tax=Rhodococcus sp. IEGM 1318 TaxID=3082226 RepID=UPI0029545353|nr:HNH endonuclease [Rhodococcus sp. IEGM 1318]MDV8006763.1 HNH endonuclease domain-containing protein [Rhodococcus sp. IEGM 1318]